MRRRTSLASAIATSVLLAGCGGHAAAPGHTSTPPGFADSPANDIASAGFDALSPVKAFSLRGYLVSAGVRTGVTVRADGRGACSGTLARKGGTAHFVSTRDASYFKADAPFWRAYAGKDADEVISYLADRWGRFPPTQELDSLCSMASRVGGAEGAVQGFEKTGRRTVDGADAIEVTAAENGEPITMTVDVAPPHYLREFDGVTGGEKVAVTFADFGAVRRIAVPRGAVDMSSGG